MSFRSRLLPISLPPLALAFLLLAGCGELAGLLDQPPAVSFTITPHSKVDPGTLVTLDASGSSDPQSYPLTYSWSLRGPSGTSAALSATDQASVTFTPDIAGQYTVALTVTATSASAKSAKKSQTVTATGSGTVNPPSSLTATASSTFLSIALTWTASPDSGASYSIYRGTSPDGESTTPVGTSTTSSYADNDPTLSGSTTYYYTVTANAHGVESTPTNEATATTVATGTIGVTLN